MNDPAIQVSVFRNDGWRNDSHLNYTIWYMSASGRLCWKDGTLLFLIFDKAEDQIEHVMRWQTEFVRANWVRLEVMVPNRDRFGNIQPGYIQDTGVLLAIRELKAAP